ncbi:hybrid sensor histidine kinase/response regulator [Leptolyngbya sp. FACHB-261]|uniref:hybrid sensor histidine kinase/response regulator n=1 Tax=Leptolyngbya sp. FACHB-261 TaxID=2692806 RepID=UPI001685C6A4|nr:hybrid sensor histidine kinase/response regulator [Leptolyngbya sp. FACHB-261]MBD2101690.1 hybrid sensor histidine kinase/response regulator [Leptolyngbya sp. FACHB-261]
MPYDKELEIQRQFLEEAQEYLNTIEAVLLGIALSRINPTKMDAALRAAHSIKGGAAMMGFQGLSLLAHRLEDFFKVLKTQHQAIELDTSLEQLLLASIDLLRQVIVLNRQKTDINEQWLTTYAEPILSQLQQRLGDPPEDTNLLLTPETQQDTAALLLETEVEGCLQRLESVLADPTQPCLYEEFSIMTQELEGLGEMLQFTPFSQLCSSILQTLEANPQRVEEIAHLALQQWRQAKVLVLAGQIEDLPVQLVLPNAAEASDFEPQPSPEQDRHPITIPISDELEANELAHEMAVPDFNNSLLESTLEEAVESAVALGAMASVSTEDQTQDQQAQDQQEETVRVPLKQLNQLSDLFGELMIERNSLDLNLERIRNLHKTLNQRVRTLDQLSTHLRTNYDKVATQAAVPTAISILAATVDNSVQDVELSEQSSSFDTAISTLRSITNRFDILEMDRYGDLHLLSQEVMELLVQIQEVTGDIEFSLEDTDQTARDFQRTTKQLQNRLTQLRMRPLSDLIRRFPRALRDLALQYGKQVELKTYGGSTLIERSVLEALSDPLMHLLRNAFDHGIEDPITRRARGKSAQGLIEIRAVHRGNQTIITVRDDGDGIDLDKIRARAQQIGIDPTLLATASERALLDLVFEPGFSTAAQITALSGRGVGMDVVRTNLRQIRGEIQVDTQAGIGTTFTITVPLALSIARVLLVEAGGLLMALPSDALGEMLLLKPELNGGNESQEVRNRDGKLIPLIQLEHWFQFQCPSKAVDTESTPTISEPTALVFEQGEQRVGIRIERCWGEQEVAVRQVEGPISLPFGFTGCTILGNGQVVPLLDASKLLSWINAQRQGQTNQETRSNFLPQWAANRTSSNPRLQTQKPTVLIVDDSINVRRFLVLTLEKSGYRVEQAKDGQDALEKLLAGLSVQAVICDVEMPRLSGYGLLARLSLEAKLKHLPVAMLTSRSGDKHRQIALDLGAKAYFSKPYREQELLQTLQQLVNS